jgi:glycosyltransferase involved in cell wall biosynthesis
VIAFDVGGLREWLKHEERGMLVEPFVIDEFARCMEALWSEPSRVRRMGEQGREFVEKHLTKKLHLDQLSRVFRNVAP